MVIGMLPRSGISLEQDLVAKVRAMEARNGNKIAIVSSANIKSGDFITVIWCRRAVAVVDNTYCRVLNCGDYRVMQADAGRQKRHPRCLDLTYAVQCRLPFSHSPSAMFNPSSDDVRRFFCDTLRKHRAHEILTPMEAIALDWILEHPEYESELSDVEAALARDYSVEGGQANPFLHLSMHLSITEQVQVDQPRGIRPAVQQLTQRLDSAHAAQHEVMECLGQMIWASQRSGLPPDTDAYIDCVRRR